MQMAQLHIMKMISSPHPYEKEMELLDYKAFLAKICLINLNVFALATWIDPQWVTAGIAMVSAVFPAQYYFHKTKKTKLENKILEKQLNEDYD